MVCVMVVFSTNASVLAFLFLPKVWVLHQASWAAMWHCGRRRVSPFDDEEPHTHRANQSRRGTLAVAAAFGETSKSAAAGDGSVHSVEKSEVTSME